MPVLGLGPYRNPAEQIVPTVSSRSVKEIKGVCLTLGPVMERLGPVVERLGGLGGSN